MDTPNCSTECTLFKLHRIRTRRRQGGRQDERKRRTELKMIELVLRRGQSCDLFLNFVRCSLCLCMCVRVCVCVYVYG